MSIERWGTWLKFCTYQLALGMSQECCCGVMRLHSQELGEKRAVYFFPKREEGKLLNPGLA